MSSVFMDDLKRKVTLGAYGLDPTKNEAIGLYSTLVRWNNPIITLICVVVGCAGFLFMGYHMQTVLKNSPFYFGTFFDLLITGITIGVLLWGVKSTFTYSIWRGLIMRRDERDIIFPFFTVEGMSDISYIIFLPFFIIFTMLFGAYIGGFILATAILFKYYLMYLTYPAFFKHATNADRAIMLIASIGSLIFLYTLITILFI